MTIRISVRDYRGLERADVELGPICLAAGVNEAGKSSLAQAARAALAGVVIPVPGVLKKDAKLLVRDGAEQGSATAADDHGSVAVRWPKAEVDTDANMGNLFASPFAVGLRHLLDLDDKERANVLAGYINSTPSVTDLAAALADISYGQKAVDSLWREVTGAAGWDGTYKKAREYSTKLKGQWEGVTGEKYGAKKAEGWIPEGWTNTGATHEELVAAVKAAQAKVKDAVGSAAVSAAEIERLRAQANTKIEDAKPLRSELDGLQAYLAEVAAERQSIPVEGADHKNLSACPGCGVELVVDHVWNGPTVLKLNTETDKKSKAEIKKARLRIAELDGKSENLKGKINKLIQRIGEIEKVEAQAKSARARLEEIGEQPEDNSAAVAEAEQAEKAARAALDATEAKTRADKIHAEIVRNDELAAILAPEGLRKRKLAAGLAEFNKALSQLCATAKWPVVRLDENLQAHYGTRPVWAASASGQWRARVVIQLAMAQMDGSAAVVIDEADILDARGRNGLFAMLKAADVRALCCMTVNKPELVPDLAKAGLGASYWIEAGIARPINGEK